MGFLGALAGLEAVVLVSVDFMDLAGTVAAAGFGAVAGFAGALSGTAFFGAGFAIAFAGADATLGFGAADLLAGAGLAAGDCFTLSGFPTTFFRVGAFALAKTDFVALAGATTSFTGVGFAFTVVFAEAALTGDALAVAVFATTDFFAGAFICALSGAFATTGLTLAAGFLALFDAVLLAGFLAAVATIDSSVVRLRGKK